MNALAQCLPDINAALFKRVSSDGGEHLLVVPHSRIYDLPPDLAARFDAGDPEAVHLAEALAQTAAGEDPLELVPEPEPQSISLNVSSACNLSCTYCYADRGAFQGAQSSTMDSATARAAIERLFATADATRPITVGFLWRAVRQPRADPRYRRLCSAHRPCARAGRPLRGDHQRDLAAPG